MIKTVVASLVIASVTLVGCGKKKEEGAKEAAKPTAAETAKPAGEVAKPAEPAAAPAAPAAAGLEVPTLPKDTGIAECDALPALLDKAKACTKLSEEAKAVLPISVNAVPQVLDMWKNEKDPAQKDITKTAAGAACKDAGERVTKALADAGC